MWKGMKRLTSVRVPDLLEGLEGLEGGWEERGWEKKGLTQ
jgi:hypothetical protein